MKRVLAVASGGGHWVQLQRLRPAFDGAALTFMTTNPAYREEVSEDVIDVPDANMWDKFRLIVMFFCVFWHVFRLRPNVIITTGAAPGFAAILAGRVIGAKTIWIDSIANSERLSSSGKAAGRIAHLWLTQWPHLACEGGPQYWGEVL